jgi:predicted dehydrogenase
MDKGVHALDTLDQLFGAAEIIRSADDSLRDGVESNARVELRYPQFNVRGTLQLSWDQALNNGLWIRGSRGEMFLGLGDIGAYRRRSPGGDWREIRATASWPTGLSPNGTARVTPDGYHDCVFLQWVGVVRAVLFGEEPAVDGRKATRVIRTIEAAYQQAGPLDLTWITGPERAALAANHWRAAA